MKPVLGVRNRLVRRLQQHANMSGLFRSHQSMTGGGTRVRGGSIAPFPDAAGLPLAKAFIPVPGFIQESAPSLPVAQEASPVPPLERSQPVPVQRMPSQPPLSKNDFPAPGTEPIVPPAAVKSGHPPEGDDLSWKRLRNIFNKHKEKDALEEAISPSQPVDDIAPSPTQVEMIEDTQAVSSMASASPVSENPVTPAIQAKREPANLTSSSHKPPSSPDITSFDENEPETAPIEMSSAGDVALPESEPTLAESSPSTAPASPIQLKAEPPAHPHKAEVQNTPPQSGPSESLPLSNPQSFVEAPDAPEHELQPLPLEDVWAVQMARQPHEPSTSFPAETDTHFLEEKQAGSPRQNVEAEAEPVPLDESSAHENFIRSALQTVSTGHASASGVELIQPRRPRPLPAPVISKSTEGEDASPATEAPMDILQRQPMLEPQDETGEPDMVSTAIGPLPEDLWKLVDVPAPGASKKAPRERSGIANVTGVEEQTSYSDVIPEAAQSASTSQAPVVQRQVATSSAPQPGSEAPASAGQPAGAQAGNELDIDELARQVFHELRNKLSLEWERLRRR